MTVKLKKTADFEIIYLASTNNNNLVADFFGGN